MSFSTASLNVIMSITVKCAIAPVLLLCAEDGGITFLPDVSVLIVCLMLIILLLKKANSSHFEVESNSEAINVGGFTLSTPSLSTVEKSIYVLFAFSLMILEEKVL